MLNFLLKNKNSHTKSRHVRYSDKPRDSYPLECHVDGDTDVGINNVQFNMGYIPGKIGIYDNLTGSVFISGMESEKICTAMWLYNGNPISRIAARDFVPGGGTGRGPRHESPDITVVVVS